MKGMILTEQRGVATSPLTSTELPKRVPGKGELRIHVHACGVCRTDLHLVEGDLPLHRTPIIPGHQIVGEVQECGEEVEHFQVGDRVGVAWLGGTCGACRFCSEGRENLCTAPTFTGWDRDGGYAEEVLASEAFTYHLPRNLDDIHAAPLLCTGIIGFRALKRALGLQGIPRKDHARGGSLGLYGFGSSAHLAIQIARYCGCAVFVLTRDKEHRELAQELGASWVGTLTDSPPVPFNAAINFTPAGEVVPLALSHLERGGTLVNAGIHLSPTPPLYYKEHLFEERTLTSVTANTRSDGRELLELATSIPLRTEVTTFPLEQANEALQSLTGDRIRGSAVLYMGGNPREPLSTPTAPDSGSSRVRHG
jgi:propanol-preferring alcohol dehydrogenase